MRVCVRYRSGEETTLDLDGTWTVVRGSTMDRLRNESGFEHFFFKDGTYDGWGRPCPDCETMEEAKAALDGRCPTAGGES